MNLVLPNQKKMQFENIDLSKLHKNDFNFIRGTQIGYIPQDPLMSLNPTQKLFEVLPKLF